ncbi:hypothetical protein AB0P17_08070 [Streptomyces sp. NPDC088124]|uniref:hypothetical protein n=1 Tax=Streptomyces sp. NPDC088124 TaxID=3154654 RepID=UPI00344A25E9
MGTVYLIVSNPHLANVKWQHIDVLIPIGSGSGDLTDNAAAITASIPKSYQPLPGEDAPAFTWRGGDRFRAAAASGQDMTLPGQEHLVLKLENIPVSEHAGLAVVSIHELAYGGDNNAPAYNPQHPYYYGTTLGLVKQTPQVPQNFRAELSLVGESQNVVLHWDGPNSLTYWIRHPDGALEDVPPVQPGPTPYGHHTHTPRRPLKRGTTYTLVAGTIGANGQAQEGYFLTTTVHALIPEFESGTRAPWIEGTTDRGRVTFTRDGARVDDFNNALGTIEAATADVHDVRTGTVKGRSAGSGWIDFPDTGITVHHGPNQDLGVVTAEHIDVTGVNTTWVGDRDGGKGWIGFPQSGIDVRKDGGQAWGSVSADTADLNSVTTQWVEGPNDMKSRLAFTDTGVKITDPDRHRGTIVAGETNVRSVVTPWVSGPMPGAGWIAFRVEGVDVMRDSEVSFGTIRAASYEDKQGGTGRPLHRRLPPYEWPPKSNKQAPSAESHLREDPE